MINEAFINSTGEDRGSLIRIMIIIENEVNV